MRAARRNTVTPLHCYDEAHQQCMNSLIERVSTMRCLCHSVKRGRGVKVCEPEYNVLWSQQSNAATQAS